MAEVYLSIQNEDPDEGDILLLGDFNDSPDNDRFQSIVEITSMTCIFQPQLKTTISDKSLYDNICYQEREVNEYTEEKGILKFDETMFGNNDSKASLAVSDHRPVWAVFATDMDDD